MSARFEDSQCAGRRNSSPKCLMQPVCQTRLKRVLATARCHVLYLVIGSLLETQMPEQGVSIKWPSASIPISYYRAESLQQKTVVGKKDHLVFCLTEFSQFKQTSYWSNTRTIDMHYACMFNCVQLCVTPWTVVCLAPLSMGFSRQEYWSGFPFPSPGDIPDPGTEPRSPIFQVDSLPSELPGKPSDLKTTC